MKKAEKKKKADELLEHQEWLLLQVTLLIEDLMEKKGLNRTEFAKVLGKSKGYITQLLNGSNITLRKAAEVFYALNSSLYVESKPLGFYTAFMPDEKSDENAEDNMVSTGFPTYSTGNKVLKVA